MELFHSAKRAAKESQEYWQWLERSDQSALDAVSERDISAIVALVWGIE
jgi:hypothetical protein